jgi:enoyl-CoA hydratase
MDWDESAAFEKHLDTMQRTFWKPSVEEIFAALADEPDEWSAKQLVTLKTKSPRTLKIAHRQLSLGLQMQSFEDNMRMEYRIGSRQVHSHDFQEGVRAVIVDKDNAPKWNPAALNDVTDRDLDAMFAPLGDDELTFD